MKKYIITLLVLAGCASSPPPQGEDWVTIFGENKLPVGSYNAKTDEALFYGSAESAFKRLAKLVIEAEQAKVKAAAEASVKKEKKSK